MENRIGLTAAAIAAALALAPQAADAGCKLAATWHLYAIEGRTPAIATTSQNVVAGPTLGDTKTIRVFKGGSSYDNGTAQVISCTLKVKANGSFANAPCDSFGVLANSNDHPTVSGKLALVGATCDFTGTIDVAGDPVEVTIASGHINGASAAGIATQGNGQVLAFNLVKE